MQIPIALIKPSDNPIRSSMDETKLNELAKSIAEHGVLEPIRVRPVADAEIDECREHGLFCFEYEDYPNYGSEPCDNCQNIRWTYQYEEDADTQSEEEWEELEGEFIPNSIFEIVYGHRRFEACKRAGLKAISGEIEWMDDEEAIEQAIVENYQRDDTNPMDTARALKRRGLGPREIERRGIMSAAHASRLLALLDEPEEVQALLDHSVTIGNSLHESHAREIRKPLAERPDLKIPVLEKAQREGLTAKQTQNVAEAVMAAPTEQARDKLLEWKYSSNFHDKKRVAERKEKFGAHDSRYRDYTPSPVGYFKNLPSVKTLLDELKDLGSLLDKVERVCEIEKASPEARLFIARRLNKWAQEFEQRAEAIHGQDIRRD